MRFADLNPLARASGAKPIWPRVKAWLVEEEPESFSRPLLEQPYPIMEVIQAPEPPVSHIYVRERGSGVFIPFAVFPEAFRPEDHGGVLAEDTAVLRIKLPVQDVIGVLEKANCLRGFLDADIHALREMRKIEINAETLTSKLRDR